MQVQKARLWMQRRHLLHAVLWDLLCRRVLLILNTKATTERKVMNDQFDKLTKGLAQSVTRRGALKKFGLGFAGIALAALGLANPAAGATLSGRALEDVTGNGISADAAGAQ